MIPKPHLHRLSLTPHRLLSYASHHSPTNQITTFLKHPNFPHNKHLKSLLSHLPPESACDIISLNRNNPQLCTRFFKLVCQQSTYCHTVNDRIHLLNLILRCNNLHGFLLLHKLILIFIKDCCSTVNQALQVVKFLDDLGKYGITISYPCYSVLLMYLSKLQMGWFCFLVYKRMVDDGFVLGVVDYTTLINGLCKSGFVRGAEMFVATVLKLGYRSYKMDVHICTSLVLGYCRIGDLGHAFQVFDEMSERDGCGVNEVTFTVLIHGLCEAGRVMEAFRLKERMGVYGCQPSTRTYTVLMKGICDMGLTDKAVLLLDEMIKKGVNPNTHTYTVLIDGLCREGKIEEANGMYRKMVKDGLNPNTVTFNALVNGYCKQGNVVSAFELLAMMEKRNSRPNLRTYNELIEGLCRIGKPYKAMILLRKIIHNGLQPESLTYNILIDGFCRASQLDMALRLLKLVESLTNISDQFAYTAIIDGLFKEGKSDKANGLFGLMMKKGVKPDEVTYASLIDGYCKNGRIEDAISVLYTMIRSTDLALTDPYVFNSLIDAFSKDTKLDQANAMIGKMLKCGVTPSVVTYTTLIDGFCQTGNIEQSLELFELMKRCDCAPNVYTFTALLNGFCQTGRLDEATNVLNTMHDSHVSPNVITYTILIKAHVKSGNLEHAFEILNHMVTNKCQPNSETLSALLEGLIPYKSVPNGSFNAFQELGSDQVDAFIQKAKKHGVGEANLYSFLIKGLYKVGRVGKADELVQETAKNGCFPDISVCCYILEQLCKNRKYDDCVVWMKVMFDHGFVPSFGLYCSLVNGFEKEGKIQELQGLMCEYLGKAGVEDRDGVLTYMEFLVGCDEHDECFEVLELVERLNYQEMPLI